MGSARGAEGEGSPAVAGEGWGSRWRGKVGGSVRGAEGGGSPAVAGEDWGSAGAEGEGFPAVAGKGWGSAGAEGGGSPAWAGEGWGPVEVVGKRLIDILVTGFCVVNLIKMDYRDLHIWREACELVVEIYDQFKYCRDFGLKNQIQRSAVSVPSNLAEGSERRSKSDFTRFIRYSLGSLAELETQLYIATRLGYLETSDHQHLQRKTSWLKVQIKRFLKSIAPT